MRDDRGALRRRRRACRELRVSADVRRIVVGIDDDTDAFAGRDFADLREHGVGDLFGPRIHDEHALGADLHGDVTAAGRNEPYLPRDVQRGRPRRPACAGCGCRCERAGARLWRSRIAVCAQARGILRIQRRAAAERRLERHVVPLREHVEMLVGARHERRHGAALDRDLLGRRALEEDVARAEPLTVAAVREPAELGEPSVGAQDRAGNRSSERTARRDTADPRRQ